MNSIAVNICNEALARLGARSIQSLQEPSAEARLAYRIYPGIRDTLLSMYHWGFATVRKSLVMQVTQDEDAKETQFILPGDCLSAIKCQRYIDSRPIPYMIRGTSIVCRAESCLLTYIAQTHEDVFPVHFKHALRSRLLANFVLALCEQDGTYRILSKQADRAFQEAKRIETAQDTPAVFVDYSLFAGGV